MGGSQSAAGTINEKVDLRVDVEEYTEGLSSYSPGHIVAGFLSRAKAHLPGEIQSTRTEHGVGNRVQAQYDIWAPSTNGTFLNYAILIPTLEHPMEDLKNPFSLILYGSNE